MLVGFTQQPAQKPNLPNLLDTSRSMTGVIQRCHPNNRRATSMAAAERITFADFQKRFKTEEHCRENLFRQRFPNGFVCPSCGEKEYYPVYRRSLCQCKKCRKQTSVTAGTVMHRTHRSLVLWFWAIYLCVNDKRGISAIPNVGNWVRKCLVYLCRVYTNPTPACS